MSDISARNSLDVVDKKVLKAYFATKTEETEYETVKGKETTYKAVGGDYLSKIATTNGIPVSKLKADNGLKSDDVKIGQEFIIKKADSQKEKGKKITFTESKKATLGDEVYIVIETENLSDIGIEINVMQGKEKLLAEKDKAISLLKGDKKTIKATVGEYAKDDAITNKDDFKDWAIAKVTLAPEEEKTLESYTKALKDATDKKTHLFLALNVCTNIDNQAEFYKDGAKKQTKTRNYYLNKENEWLELGVCECCNIKIDKDGFLISNKITKKHKTILEHGKISSIKAVVLHRTNSSSVKNIIGNSSEGTHFWVEKDGTIYQAASLNKKTWHVGKGLYSKQKDETGIGNYENTWPHTKRGAEELNKNYPNRYPINSDSVGIEVAGLWTKTSGKETSGKYKGELKGKWDDLTKKQEEAVVCLCQMLKQHYSLSNSDIYAHDDIKPKTKGEGSDYIDEILKQL